MLIPLQDQALALCRQLGLSQNLPLLEHAWASELGNLAREARILALHRETLIVAVSSAPVMQELSLRRQEFVRRLNKHLPMPWLREITLRLDDHEPD